LGGVQARLCLTRPVEFLTDRPAALQSSREKENPAYDDRPANRDSKVNHRFRRKTRESNAHYRGAAP
jgi:hypothetical protein